MILYIVYYNMRIFFISTYIILLLLITVTKQFIHALQHRTYMHRIQLSRIQMHANSHPMKRSFDSKHILNIELPTKDKHLVERFLRDFRQTYLLENVVEVAASSEISNIDDYAAHLSSIPILGLGIVFPTLDFSIDTEKSGLVTVQSSGCSLSWLKADRKMETPIDFSVYLKLWVASDRSNSYSALASKKRPIGGSKVQLEGCLQCSTGGTLPELSGILPASLDTAVAFLQKRIEEFASRGLEVRLRKALRVYMRREQEQKLQQWAWSDEP